MLGYVLPEDAPEYNEEWEDHYSLEHFNLDFQKFEPRSVKLGSWPTYVPLIKICAGYRVRKLFSLAKTFTPHIFISRPNLENFACDRAKVVLVGEAAHPLLVCIFIITMRPHRLIEALGVLLHSLAGNITPLLELKMRKHWEACLQGFGIAIKSQDYWLRTRNYDNPIAMLQKTGNGGSATCSRCHQGKSKRNEIDS
jgi:hypothetical protein